jgi:hypothetical protein
MDSPIFYGLAADQDSEMNNKYSVGILTGALAISSLTAVAIQVGKPKDLCRIEVSIPHISTFISQRQGIRAVKVNAFSTCNRPHSRVSLTVQLWKENLLLKQMLIQTVERHPKLVPAGMRVYNEGTFVPCLNFQSSHYYGVAYAKAMINGKWHFARSKVKIEIPPLNCGM